MILSFPIAAVMDAEEIEILIQAVEDYKSKVESLHRENESNVKTIQKLEDRIKLHEEAEAENIALIQELEETICLLDKELLHANDRLADVEQEAAAMQRKNSGSKLIGLESNSIIGKGTLYIENSKKILESPSNSFELTISDSIEINSETQKVSNSIHVSSNDGESMQWKQMVIKLQEEVLEKDLQIKNLKSLLAQKHAEILEKDDFLKLHMIQHTRHGVEVDIRQDPYSQLQNWEVGSAASSMKPKYVDPLNTEAKSPASAATKPAKLNTFENFLEWNKSVSEQESIRKEKLREDIFTSKGLQEVDTTFSDFMDTNELSCAPSPGISIGWTVSRLLGRSSSGPVTPTESQEQDNCMLKRNISLEAMASGSRSGDSSRSASRKSSFTSGSDVGENRDELDSGMSSYNGLMRTFFKPKNRPHRMPSMSPPRTQRQKDSPARASSPVSPTWRRHSHHEAISALSTADSGDESATSPKVRPATRHKHIGQTSAAIHEVQENPETSIWSVASRIQVKTQMPSSGIEAMNIRDCRAGNDKIDVLRDSSSLDRQVHKEDFTRTKLPPCALSESSTNIDGQRAVRPSNSPRNSLTSISFRSGITTPEDNVFRSPLLAAETGNDLVESRQDKCQTVSRSMASNTRGNVNAIHAELRASELPALLVPVSTASRSGSILGSGSLLSNLSGITGSAKVRRTVHPTFGANAPSND